MTTLKDLTWDNHKRAETTPLMKAVLKNQISDALYSDMVYTSYQIFATIEDRYQFATAELSRKQRALDDWQSIQTSLPRDLPAITAYLERLRKINKRQLWAHIYIHYLATLYGGQVIKRIAGTRFPTTRYDYDQPDVCIAEIRANLDLDLADEANIAFEMTIAIYDELYNAHQEHS